jgi:Tfp pilus assembly protein PilN
MFPTRLDLLSPQKKQHVRQLLKFQYVKSTGEIFLILVSIMAMALLASQVMLEEHFSSLTSGASSIANEQGPARRQIRLINKLLRDTNTVQKEFIPWSMRMVDIASSTPKEIVLTSVTFTESNKNVSLSGIAQTRESLLAYEQILETLSFMGNVETPLSGLTQKENITFTITGKMK